MINRLHSFIKITLKLLSIVAIVSLHLILNGQTVSTDRIYTQVDHMPQLMSCETSNGNMYKMDRCTNTALKSWFLANMEYPVSSLIAKTEEKVDFTVLVDTIGRLTLLSAPDENPTPLMAEAHRLIGLLIQSNENWVPGRQGRKKVKVQISLCIEFKIADWNGELLRRSKLIETARQDSILKASPKVDSLPKRGK